MCDGALLGFQYVVNQGTGRADGGIELFTPEAFQINGFELFDQPFPSAFEIEGPVFDIGYGLVVQCSQKGVEKGVAAVGFRQQDLAGGNAQGFSQGSLHGV